MSSEICIFEHEPTITDQDPTHLPLFNYRKEDINKSRELIGNVDLLVRQRQTNVGYWERNHDRVIIIKDKLIKTQNGLSEHAVNLINSITVSLAFLKMKEDLQPHCLSEQECSDFFRLFLQFNNLQSINTIRPGEKQTTDDEILYNMFYKSTGDYYQRYILPFTQRYFKNPPSWFKGTKMEFYDLVSKFFSFTDLLNPELQNKTLAQTAKDIEANKHNMEQTGRPLKICFGLTFPNNMPDWLIESENTAFNVSEVTSELNVDQKELEDVFVQLEVNTKRSKTIIDSYSTKFQRARRWLNDRYSQVVSQPDNLGDLVILLHKFDTKFLEGFGKTQEQFISDFVHSLDRIKDRETLSLWIENIFNIANIITQGKITKEEKDTLQTFLLGIGYQATELTKNNFRKLREDNKKGFNRLAFDLAPLIQKLGSEDLNLILEYTNLCKEQDGNELIYFIADVIAQNIQHLSQQDLEQPLLNKSFVAYKEFLGKFIRKNINWLFNQYQEKMNIKSFNVVNNDSIPAVAITNQTTELMNEFDAEVRKTEQCGLTGWQVFYSVNKEDRESSLVEIPGGSFEDRSNFLQHFFATHGISCSVKSSSIIHTLGWRTESPDYVEQIAHRKEVKGEDWKKIKRGSVRIFYQMSKEDRRVVFFVHQKQDWSYNF